MKRIIIYLLLTIIPSAIFAQVEKGAAPAYGNYGTDTIVRLKVTNYDSTGLSGFYAIVGPDTFKIVHTKDGTTFKTPHSFSFNPALPFVDSMYQDGDTLRWRGAGVWHVIYNPVSGGGGGSFNVVLNGLISSGDTIAWGNSSLIMDTYIEADTFAIGFVGNEYQTLTDTFFGLIFQFLPKENAFLVSVNGSETTGNIFKFKLNENEFQLELMDTNATTYSQINMTKDLLQLYKRSDTLINYIELTNTVVRVKQENLNSDTVVNSLSMERNSIAMVMDSGGRLYQVGVYNFGNPDAELSIYDKALGRDISSYQVFDYEQRMIITKYDNSSSSYAHFDSTGFTFETMTPAITSGNNKSQWEQKDSTITGSIKNIAKIQLNEVGIEVLDDLIVNAAGNNGSLILNPVSAFSAGSIPATDGRIIYVNTTDGTFTSVGFWGYENGSWIKL